MNSKPLQKEEASIMYAAGISQKDIAETLKVAKQTVNRWVKESDLKKPINPVRHSAFIMYKSGLSQKEISRKVGVSEKTVSAWAQEDKWKESLLVVNSLYLEILAMQKMVITLTNQILTKAMAERRMFSSDELSGLITIHEIVLKLEPALNPTSKQTK